MFGYVTIHGETLEPPERQRYQAHYCGLCRVLGGEYGGRGRATLTYDMTFLSVLLGSLYRLEEETGVLRCPANPFRKCEYIETDATRYAADLNLTLAWYKYLDDWNDDGSCTARAKAKLLEAPARHAAGQWPRQEQAIRAAMEELSRMERTGELNPDRPANCFGALMGELFAWREDAHAPLLRQMGAALGRFIYLMDAALDLREDLKKERYNPLAAQICTDFTPLLTVLMGECTSYFEQLPLERDLAVLRNILYSGIWLTYQTKQRKGAKRLEESL